MADAPRITVEELKRRMDVGEDFIVIDVRNHSAWAETDAVIPEAIRVPLDNSKKTYPEFPKIRPAVAYCTCPNEGSSASLVQQFQQRGCEDVWTLQGGFPAWQAAGLPVESKRRAA
jgi:rhodanese-related sulfurtransferase